MDSQQKIKTELDAALRRARCSYRLAPVDLMTELEGTPARLRDEGLFSQDVYEEYRDDLVSSCPLDLAEGALARTVIVVAWPSPAVKVRFHLESGPLEAVVPPTYIHSAERRRCLEIIRSVLEPAGFWVSRATGPVKLLAVHTGLAQYGRNNLAYVRGMGTFARLEAFCTDADLGAEEPNLKGSLRMSCCPPCRNCHHVCPTGCIPHDGTIIDAERCLAYLNEHEGEWPEWLEPTAHNALVGCMRCYALCPANRYYVRREPVVAEFDREETDLILRGSPAEDLPEALRAKLAALDLEGYSTVLGRNLLALRDATILCTDQGVSGWAGARTEG